MKPEWGASWKYFQLKAFVFTFTMHKKTNSEDILYVNIDTMSVANIGVLGAYYKQSNVNAKIPPMFANDLANFFQYCLVTRIILKIARELF